MQRINKKKRHRCRVTTQIDNLQSQMARIKKRGLHGMQVDILDTKVKKLQAMQIMLSRQIDRLYDKLSDLR